jgi:hypothetical protein
MRASGRGRSMRPAAQRTLSTAGSSGHAVPPRTSRALRRIPIAEWKAIQAHLPNILLEGPESDVADTLVALMADFGRKTGRPPTEWPALTVRHAGEPKRMVVVRRVDALSPNDQAQLLNALNARHADLQVIATSDASLFDRVQARAFRADLYYRLSAVRLVMNDQ